MSDYKIFLLPKRSLNRVQGHSGLNAYLVALVYDGSMNWAIMETKGGYIARDVQSGFEMMFTARYKWIQYFHKEDVQQVDLQDIQDLSFIVTDLLSLDDGDMIYKDLVGRFKLGSMKTDIGKVKFIVLYGGGVGILENGKPILPQKFIGGNNEIYGFTDKEFLEVDDADMYEAVILQSHGRYSSAEYKILLNAKEELLSESVPNFLSNFEDANSSTSAAIIRESNNRCDSIVREAIQTIDKAQAYYKTKDDLIL